jgi:hypothetical protein
VLTQYNNNNNNNNKFAQVIMRATLTISKSFGKYLRNKPGRRKIQGTIENSHIGHCTHTSESTCTNVKVQITPHGK